MMCQTIEKISVMFSTAEKNEKKRLLRTCKSFEIIFVESSTRVVPFIDSPDPMKPGYCRKVTPHPESAADWNTSSSVYLLQFLFAAEYRIVLAVNGEECRIMTLIRQLQGILSRVILSNAVVTIDIHVISV